MGSWHRHTDDCRWRIYRAYRDANDPKYKNVKHLFDEEAKQQGQAAASSNEPPAQAGDLDLNNSPAAAPIPPSTPPLLGPNVEPEEPLRNDSEMEEEEDSGRWNPGDHRQESFAEMDAHDPSVDCFLPDFDDDDEGMGDDVADPHMMDALLNAGVNEDDATDYLRAIHKTKPRKKTSIGGGSKSDREGDRHIERSDRKSRTSDLKAAPVVETDKTATFVELYGGGSLCKEAETSRRNLNLRGLGALHLRTVKPDGTAWNF